MGLKEKCGRLGQWEGKGRDGDLVWNSVDTVEGYGGTGVPGRNYFYDNQKNCKNDKDVIRRIDALEKEEFTQRTEVIKAMVRVQHVD